MLDASLVDLVIRPALQRRKELSHRVALPDGHRLTAAAAAEGSESDAKAARAPSPLSLSPVLALRGAHLDALPSWLRPDSYLCLPVPHGIEIFRVVEAGAVDSKIFVAMQAYLAHGAGLESHQIGKTLRWEIRTVEDVAARLADLPAGKAMQVEAAAALAQERQPVDYVDGLMATRVELLAAGLEFDCALWSAQHLLEQWRAKGAPMGSLVCDIAADPLVYEIRAQLAQARAAAPGARSGPAQPIMPQQRQQKERCAARGLACLASSPASSSSSPSSSSAASPAALLAQVPTQPQSAATRAPAPEASRRAGQSPEAALRGPPQRSASGRGAGDGTGEDANGYQADDESGDVDEGDGDDDELGDVVVVADVLDSNGDGESGGDDSEGKEGTGDELSGARLEDGDGEDSEDGEEAEDGEDSEDGEDGEDGEHSEEGEDSGEEAEDGAAAEPPLKRARRPSSSSSSRVEAARSPASRHPARPRPRTLAALVAVASAALLGDACGSSGSSGRR
eukprot:m51a1_g5066 hypothetical protein (509) ;mRNA; f:136581-138516